MTFSTTETKRRLLKTSKQTNKNKGAVKREEWQVTFFQEQRKAGKYNSSFMIIVIV